MERYLIHHHTTLWTEYWYQIIIYWPLTLMLKMADLNYCYNNVMRAYSIVFFISIYIRRKIEGAEKLETIPLSHVNVLNIYQPLLINGCNNDAMMCYVCQMTNKWFSGL